MKRALPITTAIMVSIAGTVQADSLKQAVEKALESNPEAVAAAYAREAAAHDIGAARGDLLPSATVRGSAGPGFRDRDSEGVTSDGDWLFSRELRLTLRQQLFAGGAVRNRVFSAQERSAAAELSAQETGETVALGVADAYLNVLRARQLIAEAQSNVAAHEEALDNAKQRADAGGAKSDQALVQGRLGLAKSVLESRKAALKTAEVRYQRYVGAQPRGLIMPGSPSGVPGSYEAINIGGNWAVRAAEHIAASREHDLKAAQASRMPQIHLEANGGVGKDVQGIEGNDNEGSFLVVGSWDLFDAGRTPAIRAARARASEGGALIAQAKIDANQTAGESWASLVGAREQVAALQSYTKEIAAVLDDYEEQFKVGQRSFLNVLDVRNEGFRARSALIDARFQARISEYRLLNAQGNLTDSLGVETKVGKPSLNDIAPLAEPEASVSEPEADVQVAEAPARKGRLFNKVRRSHDKAEPAAAEAEVGVAEEAERRNLLGFLRRDSVENEAPEAPITTAQN